MTLPELIKNLRELEKRATPGKSIVSCEISSQRYTVDVIHGDGTGSMLGEFAGCRKEDARLFSETRNHLTTLLDAVEEYEQTGMELCQAYGNQGIKLHDLELKLATAKEALDCILLDAEAIEYGATVGIYPKASERLRDIKATASKALEKLK